MTFPILMAELWRSLRLAGAPHSGETASLRVDGRTVALRLAPDGVQVLVTTEVGTLAANGPDRAGQLRRLLRDGLGTLLSNAAALRVVPGPGRLVEAVALAPNRPDAVERLRAAIEDVLHLAELHAPALAAGGSRAPEAPLSWSPGDSMIFRL